MKLELPAISLLFLLNCFLAHGFGIGISPEQVSFQEPESKINIINPNDFDVNYQISGCNFDFIECLRYGKIKANDKRSVLLRYNSMLNDKVQKCKMHIFFSNNLYSTGFSFSLLFPNNTNDITNTNLKNANVMDFLANQDIQEGPESNKSLVIVIGASVFLIVGLIVVWKVV